MDILEIRFVSSNKYKLAEVSEILEPEGYRVIPIKEEIKELQTEDIYSLVKDKLLKAFAISRRTLLVDHTGLYLDCLNGFPGGLTRIFWDNLGPDKFSLLFGCTHNHNTDVVAKTIIGYCDGKNLSYFEGDTKGKIAPEPSGNRDFQWDCVFIPEGYNNTFAELREKNKISMRRKALCDFVANPAGGKKFE